MKEVELASSTADAANLLTHAGCSATLAQNTRAKANEALATVLQVLSERGITQVSTFEDTKRHLNRIELSNGNFILVRWMED